jgi:CRP-like cAMP-binding protein
MQTAQVPFNPRLREVYPDLTRLLERIKNGKSQLRLKKDQKIFSQGQSADAVYFIQSGKVKITSVSGDGREAIFAVLGPFAFFGEACLVGQPVWVSSAITVEPATIVRIDKRVMMRALREDAELCYRFTTGLMIRIIRLEEDVRVQFFYEDSKKLARALLRLAQLDQHSSPAEITLPRWSHEALGKMVNASRSHVTRLMNQLRRTGMIDYDRFLTVKTKRLSGALPRD